MMFGGSQGSNPLHLAVMECDTTISGTVKVREVNGDVIIVEIPGSTYRIELAGQAQSGQRLHGWIDATALKVHIASGGGRFIEPTRGAPRIVAGHVMSIDADQGTAMIRSVLPVHIRLEQVDRADQISVGDLVNFYVRSGASWVNSP